MDITGTLIPETLLAKVAEAIDAHTESKYDYVLGFPERDSLALAITEAVFQALPDRDVVNEVERWVIHRHGSIYATTSAKPYLDALAHLASQAAKK